jgi:hypothetical protein
VLCAWGAAAVAVAAAVAAACVVALLCSLGLGTHSSARSSRAHRPQQGTARSQAAFARWQGAQARDRRDTAADEGTAGEGALDMTFCAYTRGRFHVCESLRLCVASTTNGARRWRWDFFKAPRRRRICGGRGTTGGVRRWRKDTLPSFALALAPPCLTLSLSLSLSSPCRAETAESE